MSKPIYTKEEFGRLLDQKAKAMAGDEELQNLANEVLVRADRHDWLHQQTWMGETAINTAEDLFAIQSIIFRSQPEYIIEVGVAWGGSTLFYASLLHLFGGKQVIGVDIFIPQNLRERIYSHQTVADKIILIEGSSVEEQTVDQVRAIIKGSKRVLVILDSHHTHEHVLKELQLYSPLVQAGQYLICGDTIVENMPESTHRPRAWSPGNSPMTALRAFLAKNSRFEHDHSITDKMLFTCNPEGFLRCIK